jgi:hypothetical protein
MIMIMIMVMAMVLVMVIVMVINIHTPHHRRLDLPVCKREEHTAGERVGGCTSEMERRKEGGRVQQGRPLQGGGERGGAAVGGWGGVRVREGSTCVNICTPLMTSTKLSSCGGVCCGVVWCGDGDGDRDATE